jgi:hypothetical protein
MRAGNIQVPLGSTRVSSSLNHKEPKDKGQARWHCQPHSPQPCESHPIPTFPAQGNTTSLEVLRDKAGQRPGSASDPSDAKGLAGPEVGLLGEQIWAHSAPPQSSTHRLGNDKPALAKGRAPSHPQGLWHSPVAHHHTQLCHLPCQNNMTVTYSLHSIQKTNL